MIKAENKWKYKRLLKNILFGVVCLIIAAACLFPFYWAVVSSLRDSSQIFSTDLWPTQISFENYKTAFKDVSFLWSFWNSAAVATMTAVIALAVCLFAAYPLSRHKFPGRKRILMLALSVTTLPQVAVL